jgi:hypothetical protein
MDTSINIKEIEAYSRDYAEKICNNYFAEKEKINGNDILELTNIKQINLLILKNLFENWISSSESVKSPYFNYDAPEVIEIHTRYNNILSRHILIPREHFEPLLTNSVKEAFLLIFSPFEFYSHIINDDRRNKISVDDLKNLKRYIKTNAHLLEDLITAMEKDPKGSMFIDEVYVLFNEVCENTQEDPEDISTYIEKFSSVIPLTPNQVYLETPEEEKQIQEDSVEEKIDSTSINEQFTQPQTTLAEEFSTEHSTLADFHESQPIESIKKGISINQKFLFVKELFNQNDDQFLDFISKLDNCKDINEANGIIQSDYIEPGKWDAENEIVIEFMEIVDKRFKS